MSDIYVYKNQLWKPVYNFKYSGKEEKFTLPSGKYLFICNGAKGGHAINEYDDYNHGGTSYGILNLKRQSDFYAVVGGDGGSRYDDTPGEGGYNGGAPGGRGYSTKYVGGAGGGGATDVRLSLDHTPVTEGEVFKIPDGYDRLDYIQSTGSQYINTEYIHKSNTKIICDCEVSINTTKDWSTLFGSRVMYSVNTDYRNMLSFFVRFGGSNVAAFGRNTAEYVGSSFIYDQRVKIVIDGAEAKWYQGDEIKGSITSALPADDGVAPLLIFDLNDSRPNETVHNDSTFSKAKLYEFQIYEGDELKACLIPCKEKEEGTVGLYDIVNDKFLSPSSELVAGTVLPDSEKEFSFTETIVEDPSLYSRIIVAGGGGGNSNMSEAASYISYSGMGGGIAGGPVSCNPSDPYSSMVADQSSGYSFGHGMTPIDKTGTQSYGSDGASGGGGGWYGGYACSSSKLTYSSANGGGGSSYVLTEESYKPEHYMDYVSEDYYFTDVCMTGGTAEEAGIIILKPTKTYVAGDKLIFPCVGWTEEITMGLGEYVLKCWGGDGGTRYVLRSTARGGYAEGTLSTHSAFTAYVNVGGSGIRASEKYEDAKNIIPTIAFNGGGVAGNLNDIRATFGGGASDIRINSDDLLARVIVAGGAGGHGSAETSSNRFGGAGGGTTGNASSGSSYGTVPGPGTQTESPTNTSDTRADGDFGNGGNGIAENSGFGGAGGGGWYGGSGCIPNGSSDNDRGGCGGSGYVLTDTSNKPLGYMLGDEFYLTNTTLETGGNTLRYGQTKIEIDVVTCSFAKYLCKDDEGVKKFNSETNEWEYIFSKQPTVEDFEEYGVYNITTDNGLLNDYEVYIYDPNNVGYDTAAFHVRPPKQTIKTVEYTPNLITKLTIDADVDSNNVDLVVTSKRRGVAENARVELTITVDIKDEPSIPTRLYCVQAYTQGQVSEYREPTPKVKTIEHIDLLPVGIGNRMPSRYKSYIGGFLDDNHEEAITTISSAAACERNRNIYTATLCNNKTVRFAKLNLLTNTSTVIKDIPKSSIDNTYYGGILVDDDYIYMISAYNGNGYRLWRTSLDPNDVTISSYSPGSSSGYQFQCYGKMEWWDDHTIIINYTRGFWLFDTKTLRWTDKRSPDMNNSREDFAVGKKYVISLYNGTSSSYYRCEIETNEWTSGENLGVQFNGSYRNCACYANGKFYITQQNYLYILDEEKWEIEKTIVTPYQSIIPKTINYAAGVLYITIANSQTLYMYDIANDRFSTTALPFTMSNWDTSQGSGTCRPVSFRGYLFVPNIRLFTINFVEYAKYNLGYKYDQFMFLSNKEHESKYTYDDRFVTFTDSHMLVHDGDISLPITRINDNDHIYSVGMDKSQYNKFIRFSISKENEDGEEEDVNELP